MVDSRLSGFYKLTLSERLNVVKSFAGLSDEETALLTASGALKLELAERMVENVVGVMPVPLGIAVNFKINGRDYLVPMAIEEPSVIAAASHAAKLAAKKGGFTTSSTEPVMIGQIQLLDVKEPEKGMEAVLADKDKILKKANAQDPLLVSIGGGARDVGAKMLKTVRGPMVVVELYVDCRDAMGANAVNTMAEAVAPMLENITGGRALLRIISNLADRRLATAQVVMDKEVVGGEAVVDGILDAYAFAAADPYRCTTHNKGVMNGVTAVVLATGNDTRAIESGAHAYASRSGKYQPLTVWEKDATGNLVGHIELPVAVGLVGGATASNPIAKIALKILGIKSTKELGEVLAAVGLAQNFAALRALATEGIQRGHMSLHARNIAIAVGAKGEMIELIAERMTAERAVRMDRAKGLLKELSGRNLG